LISLKFLRFREVFTRQGSGVRNPSRPPKSKSEA